MPEDILRFVDGNTVIGIFKHPCHKLIIAFKAGYIKSAAEIGTKPFDIFAGQKIADRIRTSAALCFGDSVRYPIGAGDNECRRVDIIHTQHVIGRAGD